MSITHQKSVKKKKIQKLSIKINRKQKNKIKKKNAKHYKSKNVRNVKTTEERRNSRIKRKLNNKKREFQNFSKKISTWLSSEQINNLAIATGYLKKINSKISPVAFIITLSCGMYCNGAATYIELAAGMADWFGIHISAQAFFGRISKKESVNFLRNILIHAMAQQITNGFKNAYATIFSKFTAVKIEDSTQFALNEKVAEDFKGSGGSASKSAMKLNTVYDITNHTITNLEIVSGSTPDQALSKNVRKQIKKGVLWIRDLGYFNIFDMQWINEKRAYFLSRMKKGVNIFLNGNDQLPININTFLENHTKNENSFDCDVYIGEGESRLKIRIIGEKVPDEVKHKRIENYKKNKIRRDKKKSMKEDYVVWFGYSVFITNAPREFLASATIIMAVYRIRWQIELFFKRIKSILQIDIIKGSTVNRVHCLIYAKLISLLMAQCIMSFAASISDQDEELSEHKLMCWLQKNNRLANVLLGKETFEDLFDMIIESYYLLCKNKRRRKSTFRLIQEAFNGCEKESSTLEGLEKCYSF